MLKHVQIDIFYFFELFKDKKAVFITLSRIFHSELNQLSHTKLIQLKPSYLF